MMAQRHTEATRNGTAPPSSRALACCAPARHNRSLRRLSLGASGRECPPHDWRCPVIMKTNPDHVAWTCAVCGAIATTVGDTGAPTSDARSPLP
jgi:hypothetical protein